MHNRVVVQVVDSPKELLHDVCDFYFTVMVLVY